MSTLNRRIPDAPLSAVPLGPLLNLSEPQVLIFQTEQSFPCRAVVGFRVGWHSAAAS